MLDRKPGGDVTDRRRLIRRGQAFQRQEQLVSLRLNARGMRGAFTEVEETAQLVVNRFASRARCDWQTLVGTLVRKP
jgi:hypothetical protein